MALQDYATFDVVHLESMVAACKIRLGIRDSSEHDLILKDFLIDAFKKVGAVRSYVQKYAVLPIENLRCELPKDYVALNRYNGYSFVQPDGMQDLGANISSVPFNTNNPFPTNSPFVGEVINYDVANFQISNGYIYFSSNVSSDYFAISYLAVNQDENGDLIIPEVYQHYMIPAACADWCLANNDNRYNAFQAKAGVNIKAVRGRVNLPDASQNQLIAYKFNTIL